MKLMLGSVQFGLDYGVSNTSGQTSADEVSCILKLAKKNHISFIDTASVYGDSERILGDNNLTAFKVTTKVPCMKSYKGTVAESVASSLKKLRCRSIEGLLFHSGEDLLGAQGDNLYAQALAAKLEGKAAKIGVSVYSPAEAKSIAERYDIDLIQLPLNILDQRFVESGVLSSLSGKGIEVHARSAFLQGLLLMPIQNLEHYFFPIKNILEKFHQWHQTLNVSPLALALAFVRSQKMVDRVVVGVNSAAQLEEIIHNWQVAKALIEEPLINSKFKAYSVQDESMVNPALWNSPR
ncbi:aldo/keto reductase [Dasania sp. GY-MA-18]|uniref:Aldo/keto reductase n=1 Tax=Dasania phycosphaerae TaxID=2950436 RepID=A0A9J6RHW8_9GAMM|nr:MULTISPECIES: aldo/keto reductase [Dasania]MCR8921379.1 aldo/keto reductase [Dasania sp. GY-MA-18]MCZ0863807.1 aldo/keto reductase [Dasania phycosphaerae]MCZ0867535.1 aldo/keto reductase [Dasania phycosphaerae]